MLDAAQKTIRKATLMLAPAEAVCAALDAYGAEIARGNVGLQELARVARDGSEAELVAMMANPRRRPLLARAYKRKEPFDAVKAVVSRAMYAGICSAAHGERA